jgi:uncharacterized protein (DUF1810 family)
MTQNSPNEQYDLARFLKAQEYNYEDALAELKNGRKTSHWMWYVFPQIDGLGFSSTAKLYSIKSVEEAVAYLAHPVLGQRLRECTKAVLATKGRSASEIFGSPDDMKLKSSMTLFETVAEDDETLFSDILSKYYDGERDAKTLQILENLRR